jgi:hypothetical protein
MIARPQRSAKLGDGARGDRASRRSVRVAALVTLLVAAAAAPWREAETQVACAVPTPASGQTRTCTVTRTGTLMLPALAEVALNSRATNIAGGGVATDAIFTAAGDTGIVVVGPRFRVNANRGVSVTLVNAATFTGPTGKPASDVSLGVSPSVGVCAGVPTTPLSTSAMPVQQAAPRVLLQSTVSLRNVERQLCFRVRWYYATNPPGAYSLPLTVSVTAP